MQVRDVITVETPTSGRRRSARATREAAAAEVLARLRVGELDDDVSDLWVEEAEG
ncbi:hypothetical protein [Rhodoplanes elegans]|uniref:hypothetical protein n=1 Tax=Rhodoplanes elegans TaxID=29408 RepID=UPI001472DF19|nr:hypothetical protein [Rhodoplanes elegans]